MIKLHKNNQFKYSINIIPKEKSEWLSNHSMPLLFTSSSDFPVYDEEMYGVMTTDLLRNELYENEIKNQVAGKVVLDIGTGANAHWALCAAQYGAKKVYAIESMKESYNQAKQEISDSRFADKIVLIQGLSTDVELPEKVDVCISEIIGCPGSSEGVIAVLKDAEQRFLKTNSTFIIDRCMTRIAACSLGKQFKTNLGLCETDLKYVDKIFNIIGKPFDLRVLIDNFPLQWIVSSDAIMEDIEFNNSLLASNSITNTISVLEDSNIDGFVCWTTIFGSKKGQILDTMRKKTNWLPIFFPVFFPGQNVKKGDVIDFIVDTILEAGKINPDYNFKGKIYRGDDLITKFEFSSAHISRQFRGNIFYKRLFPEYVA